MRAIASRILKAQDFLKRNYGDDYQRMIKKMREKTTDLDVLAVIANDNKLSAEIRLIAMAAMGE